MGGLRFGLGVFCTVLFLAGLAAAAGATTRATAGHARHAKRGCSKLVGRAETCLWRSRVLFVTARGSGYSYRGVPGYVFLLYRKGQVVRRIRTGKRGLTPSIALPPGRYTVRTAAFSFGGRNFRPVDLGRLTSPIFGPSYPRESTFTWYLCAESCPAVSG